jgi:hypothetical protein
VWTFKDAHWEQDQTGAQFGLVTLFGKTVEKQPAAPLELLVRARRHPECKTCSGRYFPSQFQFCPACGKPLSEAAECDSIPWVPPFGPSNGLKVLSRGMEPDTTLQTSGEPFPLPPADGLLAFASLKLGAGNRLLIAMQRDIGQVWVYRPSDNPRWLALDGRVGEGNLPGWAWTLASDSSEAGFIAPTKEGPAWVTVDWTTNTLVIDRGDGESVGGAARIKDCILAPVMRSGKLMLLFRRDGDINWSDCDALSDPAAVLTQLARQPVQQALFGTPVVDEVRQVVYWPGRGGYVRVAYPELNTNATWTFRQWNPLPPFATAQIELGVPYRKAGARPGFWQLCEVLPINQSARGEVHYKIIKFDGDELADCEDVESGQFLTTGRAAFSWLYDHWTNVHDFNPNEGEQAELRYPILQFGEKGLVLMAKLGQWEGREDPGFFTSVFRNRGLRATGFARFVIQGSGSPGEALTAEGVDAKDGSRGSQFRVSVAQLPDVAAFVHQSSLFIYFPDDSSCFRWPLKTIATQ